MANVFAGGMDEGGGKVAVMTKSVDVGELTGAKLKLQPEASKAAIDINKMDLYTRQL